MKSSRRSKAVRRLHAASVVCGAIVPLVGVASNASAELYRWVGNPNDHGWRDAVTVGGTSVYINWLKNGSPPTNTPEAEDTAQFDNFQSAPCNLDGNRTVNNVVFNASGNVAGGNNSSLKLISGDITINNNSSIRYSDAPLENDDPGTWHVGGNGSLIVWEDAYLQGSGFTKTGSGAVSFFGPQMFSSSISIREGEVAFNPYIYATLPLPNYINSSVFVGNELGADEDATLAIGTAQGGVSIARAFDRIIDPQANITVRGDGALRLFEVEGMLAPMLFQHFSLEGGELDIKFITTQFLPGTFTARPGLVNGVAQPASIVGGSQGWNISGNAGNIFVVNATSGGVTPAQSLVITAPLAGGVLTLNGNGTTTIDGSAANTHAGTSLRSGALVLSKTDGGSAVGGYLDVGLADTATLGLSAAVRLSQSDQIANTSTVKIWTGGTLLLDPGVSDKIGELTFAGGNISGAANTTLVLGGPLTKVVAGNGTATAGVFDLNGLQHEIQFQPGTSLTVNTSLVNGSLKLQTPGTLTLGGNFVNTLNGVSISEGTLLLNKTSPAQAVTGSLEIGTPNQATNRPIVRFLGNGQTGVNTNVTLFAGTIDLNGFSGTIRELNVADGTVTTGGGTLTLGGDSAATAYGAAPVVWNGNFNLANRIHTAAINGALEHIGVLANGSLTQVGGGRLRLTGTAANTHAMTAVLAGTLELAKTANVNAVGGGLTVGTANQTTNIPRVSWLANGQIADSTVIDFRAGRLSLNGNIEVVGGINASGTGAMTVDATGGVMGFAGNSAAALGSRVTFLGATDMSGGVREFSAPGSTTGSADFTNWGFYGGGILSGGTFRKTGIGRIEFDSFDGGTTVLDMAGGNVTVNAATFGGLAGGGSVTLLGDLALNTASTTTATYGGVAGTNFNGNGSLNKFGAGTQIFGTFSNNTNNGPINVNAGTLQLSTIIVGGAVPGTLNIASGATVRATGQNQFAASSVVNAAGDLRMANTTQLFSRLNINGGQLIGGTLSTSGGVFLNSGSISDATLNISGGGLNAIGSNDRLTRVVANVPLDLNSGSSTITDSTFRGLRGTGFGSLTTASNTTLQVDSGMVTYDGILAGPGGIIKTGAGEQRFFGLAASYFGTTTIEAGKLTLRRDAINNNWNGVMNLSSGADIKGGKLSFLYQGGVASPQSTILPQLASGFANNFSTGRFRSSNAVAGQLGLGWSDGVEPEQFVIMFTRYGDANLDSAVNLDDFTALAAGFGQAAGTWRSGDFTYDGIVNLDDFTLLAANFGLTAPADLPRASAVPEPAVAAGVLVVASMLAGRRRRVNP